MRKFVLDVGHQALCHALDLNTEEVLAHAALPPELFAQERVELSAEECFRLWYALETVSNDPLFSLHLAQSFPVEAYNLPMLAALWSNRLDIALHRFARYRRLIGPMILELESGRAATTVSIENLEIEHPLPATMALSELAYLLKFARLATQRPVRPLAIVAIADVSKEQAFTEYFGRKIEQGDGNSITFSNVDIAFLLGFDDPGSFSRAFKVWTGKPPEAFRSG